MKIKRTNFKNLKNCNIKKLDLKIITIDGWKHISTHVQSILNRYLISNEKIYNTKHKKVKEDKERLKNEKNIKYSYLY